MLEATGFCPYCHAARPEDTTVCTTCGRELPPIPAGDGPGAMSITASPTPSSLRRPVLSSWAELRSILRIPAYVVLGWIAASFVVGLTFGHAVANHIGADYFSGFSLDRFDPTEVAAQVAMFSSLIAGLGFRAFTPAGPVTFNVVPIGALAVFALLARSAARRSLRRNPPSSLSDMFLRITLGSAIAALAVYTTASVAVLLYAQTITPPLGPLGVAGGTLVVGSANATADGLFFVLFPALWIGSAAGVFSLAPAKTLARRVLFDRARPEAQRMVRLAGSAGLAVRYYLVAVVAFSPLVVAGWALYLVRTAPHPDVVGIAFSLPAVLAMGPNAVMVLALAATGTVMNYGNGSLPPNIALWQADKWLIAAGVLALVVPGVLAGVALGRRRSGAGPGEVGLAGVAVGAAALLLVNVAAASVNDSTSIAIKAAGIAAGTAAVGTETVSRMSFDLGQAALVGGTLALALVVVGFVVGMSTRGAPAPARRPVETVPTERVR